MARAATGYTFSDLHLFAPYSNGKDYLQEIEACVKKADICVINGDMYECWNVLPGEKNSMAEISLHAHRTIERLMQANPHCVFHYVVGNHERVKEFAETLDAIAKKHPGRFHVQHSHVQIGDALFLHGDRQADPAHEQMPEQPYVQVQSKRDENPLPKTLVKTLANLAAPHGMAKMLYPFKKTLAQIDAWIGENIPSPDSVKHVFFGHVHYAFANERHNGRYYHNTGAAVHLGGAFNPLSFDVSQEGRVMNVREAGKSAGAATAF